MDIKFTENEERAEDIRQVADAIFDVFMQDKRNSVDLFINALCFAAIDLLVGSNIDKKDYVKWVDAMRESMLWNLKDKGFIYESRRDE